jgi:hypothetical protein
MQAFLRLVSIINLLQHILKNKNMIKIILALTCSLSTTLLLSQKDSSLIFSGNKLIPEFSNRPLYMDLKNDKLVDLESARVGTKTRLVKLGRAGIYAEIENANSAVRILHADTLKFIARVNAGVDPRIYFELMALSIRKDKREIKVTEVTWKNTTQKVYEKIPFTISKVKDGVYILLLPHLAAGEYLFGTDKGSYAFGID